MALTKLKGPLTSIQQVITVLNKVIDAINAYIAGAGTVTSVSVSTANGFAGTVANPTTTPDITISTTVTGILKGDGTAISAAVSGTDYQPAGNYITALTGDVTATGPGSVAATLANSGVTAGTYNYSTITIDAKGRITNAVNNDFAPIFLLMGA